MPTQDDITEDDVQAQVSDDGSKNRDIYLLDDVDPDQGMMSEQGSDNALGYYNESEDGSYTNNNPFGKNALKVVGMPFFYGGLDDPYYRTYSNTFESDIPVVFIQPGLPKVNAKLFGSSNEGGQFNLLSGFSKIGNAAVHLVENRVFNTTSWRDSRWMSFRNKTAEYANYVSMLTTNVRNNMGISGTGVFGMYDYILNNDSSKYGLAFYTSSTTDVSESASNEYSTPEVAREANDKQRDQREKKMLAQVGGASLADKAAAWLGDLTKTVADLPVIGGFVAALTENLDGSQLYYPDVWSDSVFEKRYSLEFKFFSPYGDAVSIFNYVYTPFLMLFALALPQQDGYYSYKQPYIVKVSAPGRFEVNMGVIRSMSVERGGEGKWSSENLPREITVRLDITDMYPQMLLSPDSSHLNTNFGMLSYIECLAGIRYDQLGAINSGTRELNITPDRTSSLLSFNKARNSRWLRNIQGYTQLD